MHTGAPQSAPTQTPPFRTIRRARGLSLRAVARRAEVDPAFLSRIERGIQKPSLDTLYRLAGALGITELAYLLEPYLTAPAADSATSARRPA